MMLDIDFFKSINDGAKAMMPATTCCANSRVRVRKSIRGIDLARRHGGEEFVIVMPETDLHVAGMVAERLRRAIAGEPFAANKGNSRIDVTISIGLSILETKGEPVGDGALQARRQQRPIKSWATTAATAWWPNKRREFLRLQRHPAQYEMRRHRA